MVTFGAFGEGTKSEHVAVWLKIGDEALVLRRVGANPFRDAQLEALVGQSIRAKGRKNGYLFLMESWQVEG